MGDSGFGDLVRRHREAAGLTQEELAERAGLTVNGIGQLERGERRHPYPHTVRSVIAALGLDEDAARELRAAVPRRARVGARPATEAASGPSTPGAAAASVPPTSPLFGRDVDVAALRAMLAPGTIVTITGPGGVGKTTLALAAAGATGEPAAFVALAGVTDPMLVLPAIAQVLGVRETDRPLEESVFDALTAEASVLVLDNLEQVLDAAPLLGRLVQRSRATAIATSRAPLRVRAERVYPLSPLALPAPTASPIDAIASAPAAALLIDRARAQAPSFEVVTDREAEAVRAICARLDGLPLALELAAGWLRLMPPTALLERLDRALPLLVSGARDLPDRQRTLRSAIAWSESLLDDHLRPAFRRLAALASPWQVPLAAAAIDDADEPSVLRQVAALEDASLIANVPATGRPGVPWPQFAMLETIREFGLEQLDAAGEAHAVHDRIARHVAVTVERAAAALGGPDQPAALRALDTILPNIRQSLAWLLDAGRTDDAARLAFDALWFWFIRGHLTEGRRWTERVLSSPQRPAPPARMRALAVAGVMAWQQGDTGAALTALDEAVEAAGRAGDRTVLATALLGRTWARLAAGDLDGADADARTVEVAAPEPLSASAQGLALAVRVHVLAARGRLGEAAAVVERIEASLRGAGGPWGIAFALNMRAMVVQLAESDEAAVPILRESIRLSRSVDDRLALVYGVIALAGGLVASDPEGAARLFGAAEALAERLGLILSNPSSIALYERQTAELATRLEQRRLDQLWTEGRNADLDTLLDAYAQGRGPAVTRTAAAAADAPAGPRRGTPPRHGRS